MVIDEVEYWMSFFLGIYFEFILENLQIFYFDCCLFLSIVVLVVLMEQVEKWVELVEVENVCLKELLWQVGVIEF